MEERSSTWYPSTRRTPYGKELARDQDFITAMANVVPQDHKEAVIYEETIKEIFNMIFLHHVLEETTAIRDRFLRDDTFLNKVAERIR